MKDQTSNFLDSVLEGCVILVAGSTALAPGNATTSVLDCVVELNYAVLKCRFPSGRA